MAEMYRIRALEWRLLEAQDIYFADTPIGAIHVGCFGREWSWRTRDGIWGSCKTVEECKAAAEAWYRSRLESALEPVPAASQITSENGVLYGAPMPGQKSITVNLGYELDHETGDVRIVNRHPTPTHREE